MKTFVKQVALAALLVLLALPLVTCDDFLGLNPKEGEVEFVDWEYVDLPNGRAELTLYLDGTLVPVTEKTKKQQPSRSLGLPLAKMSHDYFEVVFAFEGTGTGGISSVARATWELGQAAGISGVYRSANGTFEGVDYRPVAAPDSGDGAGASIVFVGRKQTMTLLGVGFMTHINKQPIVNGTGNVPSKYLTTADRSVTFTVSPLTSNIGINVATGKAETTPLSSFLTASDAAIAVIGTLAGAIQDNTIGNVTALGGTDYPLFELPDYEHHPDTGVASSSLVLTDGTIVPDGILIKKVAAKYTVGGLTGVPAAPATLPTGVVAPNGGDLTAGVLLYDIPEIIKREPRYIAGGQTWYAVAQIDYRATLVDLDAANYGNGTTTGIADAPFIDVIPMTFYITPTSNGIFSIVFSVPVYALTLEPKDTDGFSIASTNGGPPAQIWHITPGYGQNLYNLDNGLDAGGCVLMGVNVRSLDWLEIFTTGVGFKN